MNTNTEKITQILSDFSESLRDFKTEDWNQFPTIELYMDQVVTYLERLLKLFDDGDAKNKYITSSMINNYVKEGYVKRPVNKKYDRSHLVTLYIMSLLKNVLPIPLIAGSLSEYGDDDNYKSFYDEFGKLQDKAFLEVSDKLSTILSQTAEDNYESDLRQFALQLTSQANAYRIVAEKVLSTLDRQKLEVERQEKEKEKAKEKDNDKNKDKSKEKDKD